MPIQVRPRPKGTFQLRVKHALLPSPSYSTFDSEREARAAGESALQQLKAGVVPAWLRDKSDRGLRTLGDAVRHYLRDNPVPATTEALLLTVQRAVATVPLGRVDYAWAEEWVRQMKLQLQPTPGTIRKKKGALSAVLDWVNNRHPGAMPPNPLRRLPHGYSSYNKAVAAELSARGIDARHDEEREQRIDAATEGRIVTVLEGDVASASTGDERAAAEGRLLLFRLALQTAMRMRELYTLTTEQVDVAARTIFLTKTKNGDRRSVPLNTRAVSLLSQLSPTLTAARQGERLFPFWDGDLRPEALARTTSRLSRAFAQVFERAGCPELHFHDARHEAVCRWVLTAPVPLTSEELGKAAGMRDHRTRMRYLSLRGTELAAKLG